MTEKDWNDLQNFLLQAKQWLDVYPTRVGTYIVLPSCLISFGVAYIMTAWVLPSCPTAMVVSTLLGTFLWLLIILITAALVTQDMGVVLLFLIIVVFATYYLKRVWKLIPFASANLTIALQAISRTNCGMYLVSLLFSILGLIWTAWWFYVTMGVMNYQTKMSMAMPVSSYLATNHSDGQIQYNHDNHHHHDDDDDRMTTTTTTQGYRYENEAMEEDNSAQFWTFLALLLSFVWTSKIILNTVQVTIAGVMATWCFDKSWANNCCSCAIFDSLYRSFTYSFGSICFGSLLQAIIEVIRCIVNRAKKHQEQQEDSLCHCCLDCLLRLLGDLFEYFNQWAYVFCGIYGYSYLESGRLVIELFRQRGFTTFVTNDLAGYVLTYTNFLVGVITGLLMVSIQIQVDYLYDDEENNSDSFIFGKLQGPNYWTFGISFVLGIAISSVIINVVKGAVNTLIVCFADSPAKLEDNHPELTQQLMNAWASAFPASRSNIGRPRYSVVV